MTVLQLKKRIAQELALVNNEQLLTKILADLDKEIGKQPLSAEEKDMNDLSAFFGKLKSFNLDPVEFQRKLRDEWE